MLILIYLLIDGSEVEHMYGRIMFWYWASRVGFGLMVFFLVLFVAVVFISASNETSSTHYYEEYAKQAITDIATVEAAYDATRMYYDGDETQADAKAAHAELGELFKRLVAKPAPIPATGIQEQIVFAANRCQNYAAKIGWLTAEEKSNVFVAIAEIQLREYCAVQIHAAKMRLIDYGVANGVNPYE